MLKAWGRETMVMGLCWIGYCWCQRQGVKEKGNGTVRVSLYYSAVVMFVELYLYLGMKATIEP
jgi:hypothetical protein